MFIVMIWGVWYGDEALKKKNEAKKLEDSVKDEESKIENRKKQLKLM